MRRISRFGLALAVTGMLGAPSCAADPAACPRDAAHAAIAGASGEHCFRVEVADTPAKIQRGLMHVRHLEADRGMLFLFESAATQAFWMKNTYISLDIIFIGPDGRIVNIEERAEPLSEEVIFSAAPALAALEINGGLSEKLGIRPGDLVRHPAFGTAGAQGERGAQ